MNKKKNMKTKIEKLNNQGEGICYINNKITFIKNTLPNEIIEIKNLKQYSKYNIASLKRIIDKSPLRIESPCPYFNECGGCDLQQLNYNDTLNFKVNKIKELFYKYAHINDLKIEVVKNKNDFYYRNKIVLKIINGKIGYFKSRTQEIVEIKKCIIAKKSINKIISHIKCLNIMNGEITIRSNYKDQIIINIKSKDEINFNLLKNIKNIIGIVLNDKLVYGHDFFLEQIDNYLFKVSYNSFFQVNNFTNEKIFEILKELLSNNQKVLDLYCGVGTLSIVASKLDNEVYGIEINENAIENAKYNNIINNSNVNFTNGNVSDIINKLNIQFDCIIVDPPRGGLNKKTIDYLSLLKARNIIYISCNPLTLSRDISVLKNNYDIIKYYLIDTFSYTNHIESIVLLKFKQID